MADFITPPLTFGADTASTASASADTATPVETATSAAPTVDGTTKKKRTRSTVAILPEHVSFVQKNIKTMSYEAMSKELKLSKSQVNGILQKIKTDSRDAIIVEAKEAGATAYSQKGTNKKGEIVWDWNTPMSDKAKQLEAYISANLSRPEETRPSGAKGNPAVKTAINDAVSNILKNLK